MPATHKYIYIYTYIRSEMDAFEAEEGALLGSLLLEPLVMGAGGMVFVDPLFQRVLVQVEGECEHCI